MRRGLDLGEDEGDDLPAAAAGATDGVRAGGGGGADAARRLAEAKGEDAGKKTKKGDWGDGGRVSMPRGRISFVLVYGSVVACSGPQSSCAVSTRNAPDRMRPTAPPGRSSMQRAGRSSRSCLRGTTAGEKKKQGLPKAYRYPSMSIPSTRLRVGLEKQIRPYAHRI